ncbi:response regulator transcription factor [Microvirga aerilata]|uniref:Response regulator transcription factor n=1 Tax=Microvirga aerilata TaxID=670292 RepID=A0A937CZ87_9HYPH|nr:response regulator transcription factor [Microvirga aerilata]MBL0404416.1 response regulator transcription factor [Microvirga aerilata]
MSGEAAKGRNQFLTVLICKNPLLHAGLKHLLANTRFTVSDRVFDETLPWRHHLGTQPALFIVDANNSSEESLKIINLLKVRQTEARVVAVADHFDINFVRLGIDAGIHGFCLTANDPEVLIKSLELVMMGGSTLPVTLARSLLNEIGLNTEPDQERSMAEALPVDLGTHKLSNREAEILRCIMRGEPNKVIARKLDVAEATIKVHVKAILRKVGVANRTQAAMWASENLIRGPTSSGPKS